MILVDLNVLVYAHRGDAEQHEAYRHWLEGMLNSDEVCGTANVILSSLIRIVTQPKIFKRPSTLPSWARR